MRGEAVGDGKTTVTFLGTAAVVPGGGHDTASFLINGRCLVDTGWYAALKMRSYGLDPLDVEYLFLTHCHHDHYLGLPHLLFYRAMRGHERPSLRPLTIVGPAGEVERVVGLARQFLQIDRFDDVAEKTQTDLIPLAPGDMLEAAGFRVTTCASVHPVPGLCYRFDEGTASLAFTGDTAYHPPIAEHVAGADLLVTEASFGANPAPPNNPSRHMGAPDAVRLALEAGVRRLALVHCGESQQAAALAAARSIFPDTFWPRDGETVTVG